MELEEEVVITLDYHNEPVAGISLGARVGRFFRAVFRNDLDEYDSVYNVMELTDAERTEVERVLGDARLTDPACREPSRRAFVLSLKAKFASLCSENSPRIRKLKPRFRSGSRGGAYAEYHVEWLPVA